MSYSSSYDKYQAKVKGSRVKLIIDQLHSGMAATYAQRALESWNRIMATKAVLTEEAIQSILYPYYYAFAREIEARLMKVGGVPLIAECNFLVTKWKGRALAGVTLAKIGLEVFGLVLTP